MSSPEARGLSEDWIAEHGDPDLDKYPHTDPEHWREQEQDLDRWLAEHPVDRSRSEIALPHQRYEQDHRHLAHERATAAVLGDPDPDPDPDAAATATAHLEALDDEHTRDWRAVGDLDTDSLGTYNPGAEPGDPDWREPASDAEAAARTAHLDTERAAAGPQAPPPGSRQPTEVEDALDTAYETASLADRAHDPDPAAWAEADRLEALTDLRPLTTEQQQAIDDEAREQHPWLHPHHPDPEPDVKPGVETEPERDAEDVIDEYHRDLTALEPELESEDELDDELEG